MVCNGSGGLCYNSTDEGVSTTCSVNNVCRKSSCSINGRSLTLRQCFPTHGIDQGNKCEDMV